MSKLFNPSVYASMSTAWLQQFQTQTEAQIKGLAIVMFKKVLEYSPQYSGDFAANWRISLNNVDQTPPEWTAKELLTNLPASTTYFDSPFKAGSRPAINVALGTNSRKLDNFKLGDTVFISNNSYHDEPYAWLIEGNKIKFRPGNAGGTVARAFEYMTNKYGGPLSKTDLRSLSNQRFATGIYV